MAAKVALEPVQGSIAKQDAMFRNGYAVRGSGVPPHAAKSILRIGLKSKSGYRARPKAPAGATGIFRLHELDGKGKWYR